MRAVKLNYRNYDSLMDWLFYLNLLFIAHDLIDPIGAHAGMASGPLSWFQIALVAFELTLKTGNFIAIFWAALRDEYASRLWQMAATSFTKATLFMPLAWIALTLILYLADRPLYTWLPTAPGASIIGEAPPQVSKASIHELDGIHFMIGLLFRYAPVLFIGLYKWHRWRDRAE